MSASTTTGSRCWRWPPRATPTCGPRATCAWWGEGVRAAQRGTTATTLLAEHGHHHHGVHHHHGDHHPQRRGRSPTLRDSTRPGEEPGPHEVRGLLEVRREEGLMSALAAGAREL